MDRSKVSKKVVFATLIFILADLLRLWCIFSNVPLQQLTTTSSIMNLFEIGAAFIMVEVMAMLARKTSNRGFYIPMALYFVYGLSFIYGIIGLTGWMYSHYGYDGYTYYKWFLLVAELFLGVMLLFRKNNADSKANTYKIITGIVMIGMNVIWMVAVYFSFGSATFIGKSGYIVAIVLAIVSVISHSLVVIYYGRVTFAKNRVWNLLVVVLALVIVVLNGISYIKIITAVMSGTDTAMEVDANDEEEEIAIGNSDFLSDDTRTLSERIEQYLNCHKEKLSGTVLVNVGDEVVFQKAYGYADRKNEIQNTNDEVCGIALVTEQFTSASIMQLVEDGTISLDDTLDKYVPEYRYAHRITIRQLLNMTAGITNYEYMTSRYIGFISSIYGQDAVKIEKDIEFRRLFVRLMNGLNLQSEPGTQYIFSRSDYYMLGLVIENATGMSYADYVRENILEPSDMQETYFDGTHKTTKAYYFGYDYGQQLSPSYTFSAAGMFSTANDLLKWQKALTSGKVVSAESVKKILSNDKLSEMGYGWYQDEDGYRSFTTDYGYTVCQYMNTEYHVNVVAMFNSSSGEAVNPVLDIERYVVEYLQQKDGAE